MATVRLAIRREDKKIFDYLKSGKKTIETRAATPKYRKLKPGDEIIFSCSGLTLKKPIRKITTARTIGQMLESCSIKDIHPDLKSQAELEKLVGSFNGYREKIRQHGIIAFQL